MFSRRILQFIFLLSLLLPLEISAQFDPGEIARISSIPEYPGPYETVTLNLQSYFISLEGSLIRWQQGSTMLKEGIGATSFTLETRGLGEAIPVTAFITTPDGRISSTQITIMPSQVDLLWEAKTYTPPFYKGKALPSSDSAIRIIAIPHVVENGGVVPTSNLVYTWKQDGRVLADRSGYGKNILNISIGPRRSTLTVEVSNRSGQKVAQSQTYIEPINPSIAVYQNHPLLGIIDTQEAGKQLRNASEEITLSVFPYFFSENALRKNQLEYSWRIDGRNVYGKTRDITMRKSDSAGKSQIQIDIKNKLSLFQEAKKLFSLTLSSYE